MEQNDMRYQRKRDSRTWSGLLLLTAGVLLLAYKMGAPIPHWVFTWPVLLIALGFLTGVKSRFHNPGAFILILVGGIFLIDQTSPELNFHNYIFPALLIGLGLVYLLRPRRNWDQRLKRHWENRYPKSPFEGTYSSPANSEVASSAPVGDNSEYVEINAVLGGVKKLILSKNFKGGEINSFMGGTELNLIQADIQQPVVLEVHNIFGGTKLIVPANWDVKNEVTAIFGGIDDKRNLNTGIPDAGKIITLKGTCIFGGIEVSNY
ncbi:MAG: LiaF domain-containing protein [Ginsengibacter sp.]